MTALDAAIQIRSLRVQLDVLEARLLAMQEPKGHTFGDLQGILEGQTQTSEEEIAAVKYRPKHEPEFIAM